MNREEFLENVDIFSSLDSKSLKTLAESCSEQKYQKDDIIVQQGDPGSSLFIVVSGQARITKSTADDVVLDVALCSEGDVIGEISVLDSAPRSASVIATEETTCLVLETEDFLPLLHDHPDITVEILFKVVKYFRDTNQQLLRMNVKAQQAASPDEMENVDEDPVEKSRELLVEITSLALRYWMQTTSKSKIDLAEESGVWTANIDQYGTYSTRTFDRYLNINKLPNNPRWQNVLQTAYFVLQNCPDTAAAVKEDLEEKIKYLESVQIGLIH
jgi:CRP/FNR family transcriptional regulator, cyclic AMP receptor protein